MILNKTYISNVLFNILENKIKRPCWENIHMVNYLYNIKTKSKTVMKGIIIMINNEFIEKLDSKMNISEIILNGNFNFTNEESTSIITGLMDKSIKQENFLLNISHDLRGHLNVILSIMQCIDYGSIAINDKKAKEYQEKVFNRFYQVSNKKDRENSGSGIGLDLVNYLVKSMDGSIELKSEEGNGCEFIITLPITIVEEQDDFCIRDESNKIQMLEVEFSDIYNN